VPDQRVLLIGKRAAVLTDLQEALREIGIAADLTQDVTDADRRQLPVYGAVAFGSAVSAEVRARMKAAFRTVNPSVVFVDGLAPITPVLVAQVQEALDRRDDEDRLIASAGLSSDHVRFELRSPAHVDLMIYELSWLYQVRSRKVLDERVAAGGHHAGITRRFWTRRVFGVLRADEREVRVLEAMVDDSTANRDVLLRPAR